MSTWLYGGVALGLLIATPMIVRADISDMRIPNRIVSGIFVYSLLLAGFSSVFEKALGLSVLALLIGSVVTVVMWAISAFVPGSIGMGDVKLIGVLAVLLSLINPNVFVYAMLATGVIGGVVAAGIVVRGTADRFAYAPAIMAGCWIGLGTDFLFTL